MKQAGVAILISNKIDFKLKSIKGDKEGHFILFTGKFQQEEISILNIHALNTREPLETLLNYKLYNKPHTLIVGDFKALLSPLTGLSDRKLTEE